MRLRLLLAAACIGLCLFGIRGRRGYNPIKVSQATTARMPFSTSWASIRPSTC